VGLICDTHYGAKKTSQHLHDYFELFYKNVFFPTLKEKNIKTIIHMGDCFDNRKSIDFKALEWSKRVVFDPAAEMGITIHLVTGNHDVYFKNTNSVNSPGLLLQTYSNIKTYSDPTEVNIGGLKILFLPWINQENEAKTLKIIEKTTSKCAMGHLELQGFRVNRQLIMEHGLESKLFEKFDRVYSGHYHTRSNNGKVFYLGNPYEMYWTDVNDTRGFHIFDTETLEHTPINNPYKLFYNIYYEDTPYQLFDTTEYENKIVKVIVRKKSKQKDFEKFIDKLYTAGIQDLKIVENFDIQENEDFEIDEEENTMSILNRYIDEAEFEFDKNIIKGIFQDLYRQACEVE
jgi:UDP-2,3-diacylglucosamine pyrophosphatase LpxH